MYMALPKSYNELEWYGRGAIESYEDRKEATFVGIYSSKVADQYFEYSMPQENGNKTDVRWLKLKSTDGSSVKISGNPIINFNVQDYSDKALYESKNSHALKRGDKTFLHIDYQQMGLGGEDSWNPRVHKEFVLDNSSYSYSFFIHLGE